MNKWQKGVLGNRVEEDEKILKRIKKAYQQAEKDIDEKIAALLARKDTENLQSIIYQIDYQKALKSQINGILDSMNANQFDEISKYLEKSYESGFIGTMYDLAGQGMPFIAPIDQEQVVRVLKNNSKLSKGLWGSLYDRNSALQNRLRAEMSRGISQGHSYAQMAKKVSDELGVSYNNVSRIVRTESHRIANEAALDAQYKAKEKGADIVKQWDATLDGRTRPEHQALDGQIRELDKPFEVNGNTAHYPGGFGNPALDIYCRCALLQRAKWALDDDELQALKERAAYFGLDKNDSFEDYKKKYLETIDSPEFKNPHYGKKYVMQPDGSFVEGENEWSDIYELDADGNPTKIKDGEQFGEETWYMNPDGTFSKGIAKDQAQYKLNIANNKVYSIDADKLIDVYGKDALTDVHKYTYFLDELPDETAKKIGIYMGNDTSPESLKAALKKALKEDGYEGLFVTSQKGSIDDLFDVLDDSLITKTKKSKLETLTDDLAKNQKKLNKIDNKTYSGIWKDDVKVSDYPAKKASIQAKKDWYNDQFKHLDPSDAKFVQYTKYLDDLNEFEKLGKKYETAYNKINKLQTDINKLAPKTDTNLVGSIFDSDSYSQDRKNKAAWFDPAYYGDSQAARKAADSVYIDKCGEVWRNASKLEKDSVYDYTGSYHKYNEPLRGYIYGTNQYVGVGNVDLDDIGVSYAGWAKGKVHKQIDAITDIIDKSSYDFDAWVQRGTGYRGMDKFFGIDENDFFLSEKDLAAKLLGTTPTEHGFMSTAATKGAGLNIGGQGITLNIYAPKGTKMMYVEPFSQFGSGYGKNWDGVSSQSRFGGEIEILMQRETKFRVTKVEKGAGGRWYIDMEVIDQSR